MKLPIKKKYFDEIKEGKKHFEYRDGHITFICEETGEVLRKDVTKVSLIHVSKVWITSNLTKKEVDDLFKDNWIIEFELK